jgi:hypothetical protein
MIDDGAGRNLISIDLGHTTWCSNAGAFGQKASTHAAMCPFPARASTALPHGLRAPEYRKVCPPDLVDPMRRRKILALGCGKAERAVFCARVAENASFVTVSLDRAAEPTFLLGAFGSQDIWKGLADRR